jgi:NADP-reducing hydrogenase subunit HndB
MKTLADLKKIREQAQKKMSLRESNNRVKIVVGMGTSGIAMGAREVMKTFLQELATRQIDDVLVTQTGEKGLSSMEPVVDIIEEGKTTITYGLVNPEKAKRIISEHIVNGKVIEEFVVEAK